MNVVARSPQVDVQEGAASVDDRSVAVATLPGRSRRSDAAGRDLRPSQQTFTNHPGESLDAAQPIAVRTARALFALPYFDARMSCRADGDTIEYSSERTHRGAPRAELRARYRSIGETFAAAPGSLEEFLVERYCLYAQDRRGVLRRGRVEHRPWPLRRASCEFTDCAMTNLLDIELRGEPESLLFAHDLAVRAELPRRC
ncbi:MAG: DUF2071 domain-containing protein [Planctomycetota bacterium]